MHISYIHIHAIYILTAYAHNAYIVYECVHLSI